MTQLPIALVACAPLLVAPRPGPTDEMLVRAIVDERAEAAFLELYERYTPRLFNTVRRILASSADVEDVVQETWLRAMRSLAAFQWRSSLSTWLIAIAINVAREQLEREGRWSNVELTDDFPAVTRPPADLDLERAIALLPPGFRAAFVLHDIEGFTHEDIARQLGCSAGTSKSQLSRARRALRRLLGEASDQERGS